MIRRAQQLSLHLKEAKVDEIEGCAMTAMTAANDRLAIFAPAVPIAKKLMPKRCVRIIKRASRTMRLSLLRTGLALCSPFRLPHCELPVSLPVFHLAFEKPLRRGLFRFGRRRNADAMRAPANRIEISSLSNSVTGTTSEHSPTCDEQSKRNWNHIAVFLVGGTLLYNLVEASFSIWAGVTAGSYVRKMLHLPFRLVL